jgi:DNA (cytosine-5)-methyltransferase 1
VRELSLFTGAGGGLLGTHHLLGWTTVGYVEINDYCQRVIAQRIRDGLLTDAPIFGDIRAFISEGYAASYKGLVDVVSAGWPCQPTSRQGQGRGINDERWLWPEVAEVLCIVKPGWFLGENVRGILSANFGREFGVVLRDLARIGFDARWGCLSSAAVGHCHIRDRVWIVAAHAQGTRWKKFLRHNQADRPEARYSLTLDAPRDLVRQLEQRLGEPALFGTDDGMADRVDRLEAIGNGQDPAVVRAAWEIIAS